MASCSPSGWRLLLEKPDFDMWLADADPESAMHPDAWHQTFQAGSLSRGRTLLGQIHQLGLIDVGADAELEIIQAGSPLTR